MELQVIHHAIKGEYKNKAVLSYLFYKKPGAKNNFFEEMDILNLPNPLFKENANFINDNLNINKILYSDGELLNPPPFNYYKYRGSFTHPPCEGMVL
jgi:hypothetical protein